MAPSSKRQKRKRRQAERAGTATSGGLYERSRAKDDAARAALEPLEEGERPTAVTVAAIVALLVGLSNLVLYAAGLEIQDQKPQLAGVVFQSGLMLVAAWGMWRAKYWAVLGMQVILGFVIVLFAVLAVTASDVLSAIIAVAIVGTAGTLFWFLIRAMARLQMPTRR